MESEDIVARLKALSERLDRLRRQAQEARNLAADDFKAGYKISPLRELPDPQKSPLDRIR
jgi:hypothetical protein